jgi:hypothetical protein
VLCHSLIKTSSTLSWISSTLGIFFPIFFSTSCIIFSTKPEILEKSLPPQASIASFIAFSILVLSKSTIAQFLFITLKIAISNVELLFKMLNFNSF